MPSKLSSIALRPLAHRGKSCVGIFFPYNQELIRAVKVVPGVRFSLTHKCWYVEDGPGVAEKVELALRRGGISVESEYSVPARALMARDTKAAEAQAEAWRQIRA